VGTLRTRLVDFDKSSWEDHPWRPSQAESFQFWIDEWTKEGVRLEDSDGELIKIPPYIDYDSWTGKRSELPDDAWVFKRACQGRTKSRAKSLDQRSDFILLCHSAMCRIRRSGVVR
jgi:hypothetical protein